MNAIRLPAALGALLVVSACKTVPVGPLEPIRITLVGTNDLHGWVATQHETFARGELSSGGGALLAGYLRILRAENPEGVVLIDAGDLFQGTLISNATEGAVVIDVLNALGYDAAAVGNHEFDYGPVGPISAAQPGLDPFGALKARIAQARFPLLSANIVEAATHARPGWLPEDGTAMVTRRGLKIGLIGLTTPSTPTTTLPINVASLQFESLSKSAIEAARSLRARGADLVIAAVHEGGQCSDNSHPLDLTSCDTESGEVFAMLKAMPAGTLDAVVAGHTHAYIAHLVNGTPVIESGAQGRSFGLVELLVDPATKRVSVQSIAIQDVCGTIDAATKRCSGRALQAHAADVTPVPATFHGQSVVADPAIDALLEPAVRTVAAIQQRELGLSVPATLSRDFEEESSLGSFLADSVRAVSHADVAVLNSGGLRADLKAGPLRYGAVYEVLPFDNTLSTLDVSGDDLTQLLRAAYAAKKGLLQVSGVEVTLVRCPKETRLRTVTLGGQPLDGRRSYRVAMPDYLARGGGGFDTALARITHKQLDFGENRPLNFRDELISWWQSQKTSFEAPKPGRLSFVTDPTFCALPSP